MSLFFTPPPVGGPVSVELTFSEFYLRNIGNANALPLTRLEQDLGRHDFIRGRSDATRGISILACDEVNTRLISEIEEVASAGYGPILVVAAASHNPVTTPWDVLAAGADDFLVWSEIRDPIGAIVARLCRWRDIELMVESLRNLDIVVGRSRAWRRTLARIVEAARFGTSPVLIIGETGTGKELLARCVHELDPRQGKSELVLVDGATLNPELSGSELFGHEKGAFTGAVARREGALARAHQGTLFLDEVGELSSVLQGQLLRAVQERIYKPVGGNQWKESHFRLVCATNRDLQEAVEIGSFRQDLFYRLAGTICRVPPLRERREDIPFLVDHFLRAGHPSRPPAVDRLVGDFLMQRDYPGNVRELRQVVTGLLSRYPGRGPLTVASIPEQERPVVCRHLAGREDEAFQAGVRAALARGKGLEEIRRTATRVAYSIALGEEDGDTGGAARRLQVSKRAVQMFVAKEGRSQECGARI